ncbi:MAG: C45 family autoproteolytic acyltransferase/hydrolase, partial [Melioribacteraceae bacterium]
AWFDDIALTEVTDISEYIPLETVKWHGPAFRYEDKGWIFVHIEGKPYQRGFQYGSLLADDIKMFIEKLATNYNSSEPRQEWQRLRFETDAIFLRKYEEEYLTEMKGIADGAAKAGAKVFDRPIDLLDIVAINSSIDLDYVQDALRITPNPLSGKSFLSEEDDLLVKERLHKCSAFLANNSATKDGRIVYGQIFMWGGYTGYHWNVIADIVPSEGNRLVYQTYPGGIHSGADFYMNSAGIMLGETTVQQTPYNPDGIPQSNRIRKAAQYANSIDDVVKIMTTKNNGMYTNDWLLADVKKNEIGILLLGTNTHKLWRSSNNDWYNEAKDFYFSDNNNKELEVRKEYIHNPDDAPNDIVFRPVNRDLAFWDFYQKNYGNIDQTAAFNLWNSSPINRPHACDGKITTSEMAEQLVFFAHQGKVTLREQFINENGRMPDLPNAYSRFTLGYAVASPIYIADQLKALKEKAPKNKETKELLNNLNEVKDVYSYDKESLWKGTVFPASNKENWYVSAAAAYYYTLKQMPAKQDVAFNYLRDELTELNYRLLYVTNREGAIAPVDAKQVYDKYNNYQIPRIKGTFLLHQLRLKLGNKKFPEFMNKIQTDFKEKNITNQKFIEYAAKAGVNEEFISQWINGTELPNFSTEVKIENNDSKWKTGINIKQTSKVFNLFFTVSIEFEKERIVKLIELKNAENNFEYSFDNKPLSVTVNAGNDVPVNRTNYFTYSNFFDDYSNTVIVYGTKQQIEANHTIALRYQKMVADRFTETFQPIKKDSEIDESELAKNDIIILGGVSENTLTEKLLSKLGITNGKYFFEWDGNTYNNNDDGLYLTYPNPYNSAKTLYLFIANSAQQLYQMTKRHQSMPAFALFKGDKIVKKGYHTN